MISSSPHPPESHPINAASPLNLDRAGDALALVRHTFGELPEDSLVLVGLRDGATGGHLRLDLSPALQRPSESAISASVWIAGEEADPVPEAAFAVVLGDVEPSISSQRTEPLRQALRRTLETEFGVPLLKVWQVGAGFVRDAECHEPQCCPYPGASVDEELHQALQRCPQLQSVPAERPAEQVLADFLSPLDTDDSGAAEQGAAPAGDDGGTDSLRASLLSPEDPATGFDPVAVSLWDIALTQTLRTGSTRWAETPERRMRMVNSLSSERQLESLIVCAAEGADAAHSDTAVRRHRSVLMGCTGRAPAWDRVEALDHLLHGIMTDAREHCVHLLALKAWIEWAKGRGSVADSAVQRCLDQDPHHQFAGFLKAMFEVIGPSSWARVKRHSYGWWRSSQSSAR